MRTCLVISVVIHTVVMLWLVLAPSARTLDGASAEPIMVDLLPPQEVPPEAKQEPPKSEATKSEEPKSEPTPVVQRKPAGHDDEHRGLGHATHGALIDIAQERRAPDHQIA